MADMAAGGLVTGSARLDTFAVPTHIPPGGTCIRLPDGSREWIIPMNPESRRRNLAILAETQRTLTLTLTLALALAIQPPALTED